MSNMITKRFVIALILCALSVLASSDGRVKGQVTTPAPDDLPVVSLGEVTLAPQVIAASEANNSHNLPTSATVTISIKTTKSVPYGTTAYLELTENHNFDEVKCAVTDVSGSLTRAQSVILMGGGETQTVTFKIVGMSDKEGQVQSRVTLRQVVPPQDRADLKPKFEEPAYTEQGLLLTFRK